MTSRVSILEVALGLEVKKKRLIEHLYECPVTASCNEVKRLRISAAFSAGQEVQGRAYPRNLQQV